MKRICLCALVIATLAHGADKPRLKEQFTSDEIVVPDSHYEARQGVLKGVKYKRFFDGSAAFQGEPNGALTWADTTSSWSVSCSLDAMDDFPSCIASRGALRAIFTPANKCAPRFAVGSEHYPRTESMVRFGANAPIKTSDRDGVFEVSASGRIAASMRKHTSIRTRFVRWPYRDPVDGEISTWGWESVAEYSCWAAGRLK